MTCQDSWQTTAIYHPRDALIIQHCTTECSLNFAVMQKFSICCPPMCFVRPTYIYRNILSLCMKRINLPNTRKHNFWWCWCLVVTVAVRNFSVYWRASNRWQGPVSPMNTYRNACVPQQKQLCLILRGLLNKSTDLHIPVMTHFVKENYWVTCESVIFG